MPEEVAADQLEQVQRTCPICDRDNQDQPPHKLSRGGWQLKCCEQCSMVYLENAPSDESLESDHAWEKSIQDERNRRREHREVHYAVSDTVKSLKRMARGKGVRVKERGFITKHVPSGNVLDLGCGDGRTVLHLEDRYIPFGIEISDGLAADAAAGMEPRGGRVIRAPSFEGLASFGDDFFDGAMLRAYLEHETRPMPVMKRLLTKLKPGGRIIIKVPNFASLNRVVKRAGWCGLRFPDHVNYFTPRTLRRLVETAGFEVADFGLLLRQPTSDNMWLVAERPTR